MAAAGAAGREDGGAGEGRRRPARPQWRSLARGSGRAVAGEGPACCPARPRQRTRRRPVRAPPRAGSERTRRALAARAWRVRTRAVPPPSSGGRRGPPRPACRDAQRLPEDLPFQEGAAPARPPPTRRAPPDPAPRSRCPGPSPLRGGTWAARRACVCGLHGGWSPTPRRRPLLAARPRAEAGGSMGL
jgi:hypothetical protein